MLLGTCKHPMAELHRRSEFALLDQLGVRFKKREDLFLMGNGLLAHWAALHQIDMFDENSMKIDGVFQPRNVKEF